MIVKFHFLHLGRRFSAAAVDNAVSTEIIIAWTVVKVPAVAKYFLSIPVLVVKRLVNIIPDETSLKKRFLICQIRVLVHGAAGISHRVRILAEYKRLAPILLQKFFDRSHAGIHLALHVGNGIDTPVIKHPFIVD